MTKSVLLAGVLGGVFGAVFAFGLSRAFPAVPPPPPAPRPSEARPLADDLIARLRAGKTDDFLKGVRAAFAMNDEKFNQEIGQPLLDRRRGWEAEYGPNAEFEFVRETLIGPNLVRFAYLEKFLRGCVVWTLVYYNGPTGWQVLAFTQQPLDVAFRILN